MKLENLGHAQVWWARLDKVRPVVVLTRSAVAPRMTTVVVAPVTSTARGLRTEVPMGPAEGVKRGSVASLDNVSSVSTDLLQRRIGVVSADRWPDFCAAMANVMAC